MCSEFNDISFAFKNLYKICLDGVSVWLEFKDVSLASTNEQKI